MKNLILLITIFLISTTSINAQCGYTVTVTQISDGPHRGDAVAQATVTLSGGSANYDITWDYEKTNNLTSPMLIAGTHTVVLHDSIANCTSFTTFTLVDTGCPLSNIKLYASDECFFADGYITNINSIDSGDYGTIYYLWNTGATTQNLFNLVSGTYTLTATIANTNCIYTASVNVYDDTCNRCDYFHANIGWLDSCGFNDLSLFARPYCANFIPSNNYRYLWNNGDTTASLIGKTSGTFRLTITDLTYGCVADTFISLIDDTCSPCISFYSNLIVDDSCGHGDLKIIPLIYNGSGNYSYLWSNGSTDSILKNQTTDSFYVTITDLNKGCTWFNSIYKEDMDSCANPCPYINPIITSFDSCQLNDASINIHIADSNNTYTFLWSTGANSKKLTGLSSGIYNVTITGSNGCVYNKSITIIDSVYKCCTSLFNINDSVNIKEFNSISTSTSPITYYGWSYGDNSTGVGQSTNHVYSNSGFYTVCHFIETASGCKDTSCQTLIAPSPGKNLKIVHFGSPYILDTFKTAQLIYVNMGTSVEYPVIEYSFPSGCSLLNANPSPTSIVGNKFTYNIGQLNPGQMGVISVKLHVPGTYTLGSLKGDTSKILSYINDVDTLNNINIRLDSVVGSWDPNEKLAVPQGIGSDGNIPMNTKEINYLIHFQNEGNWRTYNVRVEDEIDPSLDLSTLSIGDVSHPYRMVVNGSKLTWYFDNIELTPKAQNEEKSQGHIAYTLKLKKGLGEGTQIKNTAYIYFDKNPAIVTNTTVHTLKVDAVTNGIQSFNMGSNQIQINRNHNDLTLSSDKTIEKVEVFNMSGQKVNENNSKAKKAEFEISNWPSGIYLFNIKAKDEVFQLKIKL